MGDTLQHCLEELGDNLWDAVKEERQLLKRQVTLLKDSLAAASGETAGKATLQEAMGEGEERVVPSVPEMGDEESLVEEPEAEEEKVRPLADLLPRPPPGVPSSPVLKARPTVIKKIKMKQLRSPQGEEQPPPQVGEHFMLHL